MGLYSGIVVKNLLTHAGDAKDMDLVRKIPLSREWQFTPVFWPGKFHGQRNLECYSSWACKESDKTEHIYIRVCVCVCVYVMLTLCGWGESKLSKMACSGSVTPHFANDDYITACSTAHAYHKVYVIAEIVYSTVRGCHELLAWSQAVCNMCM